MASEGKKMDNKKAHLEMIQGVINRMSNNSFLIKGWAVTLVAGIFALSSKDNDKMFFLVAYIPIILFWGLDSYYLLQERLYRSLYNFVRLKKDEDADFSMKATKEDFPEEGNSFWSCVFSKTEIWFYFPLALVTAGIIIISTVI